MSATITSDSASSDTLPPSNPSHSPPPSSSSSPTPTNSPSDFVLITSNPLESYNPHHLVSDPTCGGISAFLGLTRSSFEGRRVVRLEYECYQVMAEKELHLLCGDMRGLWSLCRVAVIHRTGDVPVGEVSVVIAASSVHRRDCLDAVSWAIDELKRRVPIWKKEVYEDGSVWKQNAEYHVPSLVKQQTDVVTHEMEAEGKE